MRLEPISSFRPASQKEQIALMDEIRGAIMRHGLDTDPGTYELLWHHQKNSNPAMSQEIESAQKKGELKSETVTNLRRKFVTTFASAEIQELLSEAETCGQQIAESLELGQQGFRQFGILIVEEEDSLRKAKTTAEILAVVSRLQAANIAVMAANEKLEKSLSDALQDVKKMNMKFLESEEASRKDPLTGLPNRRGLEKAVAALQASPDSEPMSVAIIDLDRFKQINDRWGHRAGDDVLRCVASLVKSAIDENTNGGVVGRIGGEEFLCVIPKCNTTECYHLIERIRKHLARGILRRSTDEAVIGQVTMSTGINAVHPGDCIDMAVEKADKALYAAKSSGRNQTLINEPTR